MKRFLSIAALALAAAFLALTFVNASWIAPVPKGKVKLIAHRGVHQLPADPAASGENCATASIEPPFHRDLENTIYSISRATNMGAALVEADLSFTKDNEIVLLNDEPLECKTNGKGAVSSVTLEELQALDIGHGYTADDGATFPFRGKGVGRIQTLEQTIQAIHPRAKLMLHIQTQDAAELSLLTAKLKATGRDLKERGDAFIGPTDGVAKLREEFPGVWAFSMEEAQACTSDYVMYGWTGIFPESCKDGTLILPIDQQFFYWGWPNRLIARMEENGGRIIVVRADSDGEALHGLTLPEQLGEIPASSNSYVWVDDSLNVIPALIPDYDNRTFREQEDAKPVLEKRRAGQ